MKHFIILSVAFMSGYICSAQNVGIGTTSPSEKLHVVGNIRTDTIKSNAIRFTPNAAVGKVLTSDANGNASWQTAGAGSIIATNGLGKTNDSVKLGGVLTENSFVRLNSSSFTITDTGTAIAQFINQPGNPLGTALGAAPITQTFMVIANAKLTSVELFVTAFGGSSITVHVKDNSGAMVGSATNSYPSAINNWSPFTFSNTLLNEGALFTLSVTATGTAQILFDSTNAYAGGSSSIGATADFAFKVFHIAEKSLLYLKENKVGIGTSAPAFKLDVSGSMNTDSVYRIGGERVLSVNLQNTIVGIGAGQAITTGNYNTAAGFESLYSNTTGERNTAFGLWALRSNISGNYNTAIGKSTLHLNSTGSFNTANGYEALYYNTTGAINTAVGYLALSKNTTGERNTAFGSSALYANTTASYNTALGTLALANNVASENTAAGYYALAFNTTGQANSALGTSSLNSNTTGNDNTASGYQSLYSNTIGNNNTANGNRSLYTNSSGSYNTANGNQSLYKNTTGDYNIANGFQSLYTNTTGYENTATGYRSLFENNTGYSNTAIGYKAFQYGNAGYENTALGAEAGRFEISAEKHNATAIGFNAIVDNSNRVRIGNTFVTSIGGQVGWTTVSDGRYKQNVQEDVPGIEFIKKLRPVTYTIDIKNLNENYYKIKPKNNFDDNYLYRHTGFIAQEVERSATELGFSFSGVDKPGQPHKLYGLRYAEFVVPLVKAVQEQQVIIEKLTKQVEATPATELPAIIGKQQQMIETLQKENEAQKNSIANLQKQMDELRNLLKK